MTGTRIVVKQWRSERFARKRRIGQFDGQFLEKIGRSLSLEGHLMYRHIVHLIPVSLLNTNPISIHREKDFFEFNKFYCIQINLLFRYMIQTNQCLN